jgi:hypothetical protein
MSTYECENPNIVYLLHDRETGKWMTFETFDSLFQKHLANEKAWVMATEQNEDGFIARDDAKAARWCFADYARLQSRYWVNTIERKQLAMKVEQYELDIEAH